MPTPTHHQLIFTCALWSVLLVLSKLVLIPYVVHHPIPPNHLHPSIPSSIDPHIHHVRPPQSRFHSQAPPISLASCSRTRCLIPSIHPSLTLLVLCFALSCTYVSLMCVACMFWLMWNNRLSAFWVRAGWMKVRGKTRGECVAIAILKKLYVNSEWDENKYSSS